MSRLDFNRLREAGPECPSNLVLDWLAAGELPPEKAAAAEAHVAGCATCRERLELRRAGFDAIPGLDPRASLARLRTKLATKLDRPRGVLERMRDGLRRWWGVGLPLALASVAALVLVLRPHPTTLDDEPGGVRWKGGLRLRVHRMSGKGSEEIESGTTLHAGDRLRFIVDLPAPGHIRVFVVESKGHMYVGWPQDGGADTKRPAGPAQVLPGAVEVDEKPERETLYLVHCPLDAGPPSCTSRGADAPLECTKGCGTTRFVLNEAR